MCKATRGQTARNNFKKDLTGSVIFVRPFSFCPAAKISVEIVNRLEKTGSHTDRAVHKTDTPVWRYW